MNIDSPQTSTAALVGEDLITERATNDSLYLLHSPQFPTNYHRLSRSDEFIILSLDHQNPNSNQQDCHCRRSPACRPLLLSHPHPFLTYTFPFPLPLLPPMHDTHTHRRRYTCVPTTRPQEIRSWCSTNRGLGVVYARFHSTCGCLFLMSNKG